MPLENRDLAYLWDMREAAREIVQFVQGMKWAKFENDKVVRYAVERQLLVIGEAANHVSDQFRKEHPEIPWGGSLANAMCWHMNMGKFWLSAFGSRPPRAFRNCLNC